MIGKRLPTGKQWEAGALAAVPSDYETVQYVAVPVANPVAGQPALIEWVAASALGIGGADSTPIYIEDGVGGFDAIYDNDGNPISI